MGTGAAAEGGPAGAVGRGGRTGATGRGWQTPPYGGVCSALILPGLKKSSRSATGAVLHPADNNITSAAVRFMAWLLLGSPRVPTEPAV
jgi:hypothetical protein